MELTDNPGVSHGEFAEWASVHGDLLAVSSFPKAGLKTERVKQPNDFADRLLRACPIGTEARTYECSASSAADILNNVAQIAATTPLNHIDQQLSKNAESARLIIERSECQSVAVSWTTAARRHRSLLENKTCLKQDPKVPTDRVDMQTQTFREHVCIERRQGCLKRTQQRQPGPVR
jgi:hypothetical protein